MINDYKCICLAGFYGQNCDSTNLGCGDNPCRNEGACIDTEVGYDCQCAAEWSGLNCETLINPCAENPCRNNGESFAGALFYSFRFKYSFICQGISTRR